MLTIFQISGETFCVALFYATLTSVLKNHSVGRNVFKDPLPGIVRQLNTEQATGTVTRAMERRQEVLTEEWNDGGQGSSNDKDAGRYGDVHF